MNRKTTYNIGVLIGGSHTYFPKEHIRGITDAAKELNINICFFLGTQTKDFFEDILGETHKDSFDYQFNTIHDYSLMAGLDGLIINYGTLGLRMKNESAKQFALKFNSIPTVFLTELIDAPNCHSLICDNTQGIHLVMEHLIQKHHCHKILFVAGPTQNTDATERKTAYLEMMHKYNLPVTPAMIAQGDYSEFVDRQVNQLLDDNPDAQAIVFANDEMAFTGYRVCEKRGLTVGQDILITGFDNCERASGMDPSLTTVQQDGVLMGKMAVYDLFDKLNGKEVHSRRVPVSLCVRESCGCQLQSTESFHAPVDLTEQIQRLNRTITNMKLELISFQRKSWFFPFLARKLNACKDDEHAFLLEAMKNMRELQAKCIYLFLLDEPIVYHENEKWACPQTLKLAAYSKDNEIKAFHPYDRQLVTAENGLCQLMTDEENHQFMVFLLFSGEKQYGLLACDIQQEAFPFFFVISLQIGLSLSYLEISKAEALRRREMSRNMELIQERNRILGKLSNYDELTGLLNLRGFTEQLTEFCKHEQNQCAYIICGDLDHLKEINDTWGHPAGNFALRGVARILEGCLRRQDTLARVGGDEFLILLNCEEGEFDSIFRKRVKDACNTFNAQSEKPFLVEISLGIARFHPTPGMDTQEIIALADQDLYEAKKHRRKSIRRPEAS